jgi:RNA polymerase sigma factor (sigma-70 family)
MFRKDPDTNIGGNNPRFCTTRCSIIAELQNRESAHRNIAYETLIRMYWKPVYKYLRIKWNKSNEDAKDLTQSFFAAAIEKDYFQTYDHSRSLFRTFLRTCLDRFVLNQEKSSHAIKHGGRSLFVSFDFHKAEAELIQSHPSPHECFEKEWMRSLFTLSLEQFRAQCLQRKREIHFRLFEMYDIDRDEENKPTYDQLAGQFAISITDVTNYLAAARREFRKIVLQNLRDITGSEREFRAEQRRLFHRR